MENSQKYDYVIIGAGAIGMSIARSLKKKNSDVSILIIEKEPDVGRHSSGRNSGVLHAGFYYTADTFKAKFTVDGNRRMKAYCQEHNIPINYAGKLVVAQNESELESLYELHRRGEVNGSNVRLVSEAEAREIDPNVKTFKQALYSPNTANIDPAVICHALKADLMNQGVSFIFNSKYLKNSADIIETTTGTYQAKKIITCAGLYADKVAHDFGYGSNYTMIPFRGLYLKYTKNKADITSNIYPVPNLTNPFLGVHFTKTVDGEILLGPTAIPALWRENYSLSSNFKLNELFSIMFYETKLFFTNSFHFRTLAFSEMKKYWRKYFIGLAEKLVRDIDPGGFTEFTQPGIRAQLLDKRNLNLVMDFVVEGDQKSVHVLNAISPAFTCAFPFADYVTDTYILN